MESSKIIRKTIDYIENNLEYQLSLEDIAKTAGYSKFHLNRVFVAHVGCTIYKYIQLRRLTIAAEQLVYTKKAIIEIAHEANYSSQQSFTFAFSQLYGHPPQAYRAKKIFVPEFSKFKVESRLVMVYMPAMKGEGAAA